jgi:hypothetical protein
MITSCLKHGASHFVKSAPLTINQHMDNEALRWLITSLKVVQVECSDDDTALKRLVNMAAAVGADGCMSVRVPQARALLLWQGVQSAARTHGQRTAKKHGRERD